jgi:DNA adenine methylase
MNKTKPFLKWAGSKYRCLDHILGSLPMSNRLIEPFTGSGAIFMNTTYPSYLLAEGNLDLIHLFTYIQKEGQSFIAYCEQLFNDTNNCDEKYYMIRQKFNQCSEPRQRAALFLYLNRHGYNGLCRYNLSGGYNVPFGRYKKPYFPRKELFSFHEKAHHASFLHADFRDTFRLACSGDVIYCDPPYAPLDQSSNFSSYLNTKFGEEEQIILAQLAVDAANRGISVVISNHDTSFTRHQYRGSEIASFPVKRSISCQAHNRHMVQELVAVFRS